MNWKQLLASITDSVDEELRLRNAYLTAGNRILHHQITGRVPLANAERTTLAELGQKLGKKALAEVATIAQPDTSLAWHRHFGFQEVPNLWVATSRWHAYAHQLDLHRQADDLTDSELAELAERMEFWRAEVDRLTELEKRDFWEAHPQFD